MRSEQYVRQLDEAGKHFVLNWSERPVLEEIRFLLFVHIKPRSTDLTSNKAVYKRLCVNERTTARVYKDDIILHECERVLVNEMVIFRRKRTVQADVVAVCKKLIALNILRANFLCKCSIRIQIVQYHLHTISMCNLRQDFTNFTGTNDAHRLSIQVAAYKSVQHEVTVAGSIVSAVHLAVQCLQKRHGVFSNSVRRVRRNTHHMELAVHTLQVNVVVASTAQGNELHSFIVKNISSERRNHIVHKDTNRIMILCKTGSVFGEVAFKKIEFEFHFVF